MLDNLKVVCIKSVECEFDADMVICCGDISMSGDRAEINSFLDMCRNGDRVGCLDLAEKLAQIKPKVCSFGHIHEAYGVEDKEILDPDNIEKPGKIMKLINCSVLNLQYKVTNSPVVINL